MYEREASLPATELAMHTAVARGSSAAVCTCRCAGMSQFYPRQLQFIGSLENTSPNCRRAVKRDVCFVFSKKCGEKEKVVAVHQLTDRRVSDSYIHHHRFSHLARGGRRKVGLAEMR